jgi:uncharacterized CHY-type Zn-finger protein
MNEYCKKCKELMIWNVLKKVYEDLCPSKHNPLNPECPKHEKYLRSSPGQQKMF